MTSSGGREATAANLMLDALWRVYRRPERPEPWSVGGNLPWDEPEFSRRMLREHLDESHGAATRQAHERQLILRWLWEKLSLTPGQRVLDVTCGPGLYAVELARRGLDVTGIDFAPAAVEYARQHAADAGVDDRCRFLLQDVREMHFGGAGFDAALLLYGQLAVFKRDEAGALLREIAASLRTGGRLVVELLDQERVDRSHSTWWSTGDDGLWGDTPYLHLGERYWSDDERISITRFHVLHLGTGEYEEIHLCDQTYADTEMEALMKEAGFATVDMYRAWDGLPLFDAETKIVYVAWRG